MPDVFARHNASLASLETYMSGGRPTVIWNALTLPCLSGSEVDGKSLGDGGYKITADVRIHLRTELFAGISRPKVKQTISYIPRAGAATVTLRIDEITNATGDSQIILGCNSPNQSAQTS